MTCKYCGLITNSRARIDLALQAYDEEINLDIINYGLDSIVVERLRNQRRLLFQQSQQYNSPVARPPPRRET